VRGETFVKLLQTNKKVAVSNKRAYQMLIPAKQVRCHGLKAEGGVKRSATFRRGQKIRNGPDSLKKTSIIIKKSAEV